MPATTPGTVNQFGIRRERQSHAAATHVSASVSIQTVVRASIRVFVLPFTTYNCDFNLLYFCYCQVPGTDNCYLHILTQ